MESIQYSLALCWKALSSYGQLIGQGTPGPNVQLALLHFSQQISPMVYHSWPNGVTKLSGIFVTSDYVMEEFEAAPGFDRC